jgi:hypothetical protein
MPARAHCQRKSKSHKRDLSENSCCIPAHAGLIRLLSIGDNQNSEKILIITAFVAGTIAVRADDDAGFQASLTPSIAIHPSSTRINGLSLSIWGENPQKGVALGFVNGSTGESSGFSWGLANYAESYTGVQWAIANYTRDSFVGWQCSCVNYNQGSCEGLEWGFVNVAQKMHGLQMGVVNYADNLNGVQLGFANIANNDEWFSEFPNQLAKGFVFVNWSF